MSRSNHVELNKKLQDFYTEYDLTVADVARGCIGTGYYKAIKIEYTDGLGFYISITAHNKRKGFFAIDTVPSINTLHDEDIEDWESLSMMLMRVLIYGQSTRKYFWNMRLIAQPPILTSLLLRTSMVLLPVNSNGFPVEQMENAHHLELYTYLLAPEFMVYGLITDQRALDVSQHGLLIPDSSGSVRNYTHSLFQIDQPYLAVTDLKDRFSEFDNSELKNHFVNSLILIDRIDRSKREEV